MLNAFPLDLKACVLYMNIAVTVSLGLYQFNKTKQNTESKKIKT